MRIFDANTSLVFVLSLVLLCVHFKSIDSSEIAKNHTRDESPINGELLKLGTRNLVEFERSIIKDLEESKHDGGGKRKGKKKKDGGMMEKMLPFMVIPFMISSMMIPMALIGLKLMLLKSAFIGKIGIVLLLINMFTRFNSGGGVYSHNIHLSPPEKEVAMAHYGYNGDEEYGAYVHHRKRRRRR